MSRFVSAARQGENHWAYYGLTVVVIMLAFYIGQVPIRMLIDFKTEQGGISSEMLTEFYATYDFRILGLPSYIGLLLMLIGHVLAAIVLCLVIVYVHKRPLRTVITSRRTVDFQRIFFAFGLWMALSFLAELVMYGIFPGDYSFHLDLANWLPLLAVSLLVLPIQTSFEEVFIRGYLLQGLSFLTRSKWVIIAVTSLIFALIHLSNPEVREFGLGLMGFYYLSVALFLVIVTFLDEGLELALGIHAATNVYGASIVSFDGSVLQTETLVKLNHLNPLWMIALFFVMMAIFIIIAARKYRMHSFATLFNRIEFLEKDEISTEL
jgi:membrane protease YdiL (CAAX protease family)